MVDYAAAKYKRRKPLMITTITHVLEEKIKRDNQNTIS